MHLNTLLLDKWQERHSTQQVFLTTAWFVIYAWKFWEAWQILYVCWCQTESALMLKAFGDYSIAIGSDVGCH